MFNRRILSACLVILLGPAFPGTAVTDDPPACSVEPAALNFGSCTIEQDHHRFFTITNSGGGILTGAVHEDSRFRFRDLPSTYPYALAAGQTDTIWVEFHPLYCDDYYGTINFSGTFCEDLPCHGAGQIPPEPGGPDCLLVPLITSFGNVVIGESSESSHFLIINNGGGTLDGSIAAGCGDFTVDWPGPFAVTCDQWYNLTFTPTVAGPQSCVIPIEGVCLDEPGVDGGILVSGLGLNPFPTCEVSTDTLDFGPVPVGTSGSRPVLLANYGNELFSGDIGTDCADFDVGVNSHYVLYPGDNRQFLVTFTPAQTGQQVCTLDTGLPICADVVLKGTGVETAPQEDVIGIYFEQSGLINTYQTSQPDELVTAYLIINNPSTDSGVLGWECCVEVVGDADPVWFELRGSTVNLETPPCFAVGLSSGPLPGQNAIVLATVNFIQPSPDEGTFFYIHPLTNPSVPGVPAYVDGANPGILIPLGWSSGAEELPVARVNDMVTVVPGAPAVTILHPNFPNPFNPATTIEFELARPGPVRLEVHDLAGRLVATLVDEALPAATHRRTWEGKDDGGRRVSSGVYDLRLVTGEQTLMRKMTLLK